MVHLSSGDNEQFMYNVNPKNTLLSVLTVVTLSSILTACTSGRYQQQYDSIPDRLPNKAELRDAIPRPEAKSRGGNKNYQVFGKSYQVLHSAENFEQIGQASWYGEKFHGHLTSNGEIYDMYAMSAAHKSLPLPTYLKVTNLANNKSVIVRVNDRGPFHQSRIIDLSYSAAYKLDMHKQGTAKVKISAISNTAIKKESKLAKKISAKKHNAPITPSNTLNSSSSTVSAKQSMNTLATPYIQVFATRKKKLADTTSKQLSKQYKQVSDYYLHQGIYRIQIGPINDLKTLNQLLVALKANGYPNAFPKRKP